MSGDIPSISNYASASNSYTGAQMLAQMHGGGIGSAQPMGNTAGPIHSLASMGLQTFGNQRQLDPTDQYYLAMQRGGAAALKQAIKEAKPMKTNRRLVQVYIADTDVNVPLESTLLYSGEQKITDATDQELFFDIDIKTILAEHNAKRVKLINKAVKERTEYLEPVKVRDLKMTVVDVATF